MLIESSKLKEETSVEEKDGKITLTKHTNINAILEANAHAKKDSQNGFSRDRSYRRVMSVPMETLLEWKKEFPEILSGDGAAENKALQILINREENKIFATVQNIKGIF